MPDANHSKATTPHCLICEKVLIAEGICHECFPRNTQGSFIICRNCKHKHLLSDGLLDEFFHKNIRRCRIGVLSESAIYVLATLVCKKCDTNQKTQLVSVRVYKLLKRRS